MMPGPLAKLATGTQAIGIVFPDFLVDGRDLVQVDVLPCSIPEQYLELPGVPAPPTRCVTLTCRRTGERHDAWMFSTN
jgi:hypothetical protein